MRRLYTLLFQYVFLCPLLAQNIQPLWVRMEDNDGGLSQQKHPILLIDSSHNVILCASTYDPGPVLGFTTSKYDSDGNLLWHRIYQPAGTDLITAAATDAAGAIYVGGNSTNPSTGQARFIVFKYAANGDSLWEYSYSAGTANGYSLAQLLITPEQDLLIVGNFNDVVGNNSGLVVSQLDPSGSILWETIYDEGSYAYGVLDAVMTAGQIIIWGRNGSPEGVRFVCWRLDTDGQTSEVNRSEPYSDDFSNSFHLDHAGKLYIGDYTGEYKVRKYNLTGDVEWEYNKVLSIPDPNGIGARLWCIKTDSNANVYISGQYNFGDSIGISGLTSKLSADGGLLWEDQLFFEGYGSAGPYYMNWLTPHLLALTGPVTVSLEDNYYDFFLAFYGFDGIYKKGVSKITGNRNWGARIIADDTCFYVSGLSEQEPPTTNIRRHFLCKYNLSALSPTSSPLASIQILPLYPNPFHDVLSFDLPTEVTEGMVQLLDGQGRVICRQRLSHVAGQASLKDLGGLPAGVYTLAFQTKSKTYLGRAIKAMR